MTMTMPAAAPPAAEPWPAERAAQLQRTAFGCLSTHDCQGSRRLDMRENCEACCLVKGEYSPTMRTRTHRRPPNVAGWLRIYIQAGKPVRRAWYDEEMKHAAADNPAYHAALLRDIATFGIAIVDRPDPHGAPTR